MEAKEKPEIFGHNIVLLGELNPKIFQPSWFAAMGLLRQSEAEEAEIQIIQNEVVSFQVEWLKLQVTRERIIFSTAEESHFDVIRDLVVSSFRLLKHTPLRQLGINWNMHFRKRSVDECHEIGNRLAPKEFWSSIMENPGLASLTIQSEKRPDGYKGCTHIKVEPSQKIDPGVFVSLNDHFEVNEPKSIVGCEEIIGMLSKCWSSSKDRALLAGPEITRS